MAKKFKFKIRVQAEHTAEDNPNAKLTFADAANNWYNTVGKKSLEAYFEKVKLVKEYSTLSRFSFGDSVDKETYD